VKSLYIISENTDFSGLSVDKKSLDILWRIFAKLFKDQM
jgi:hypothetical protein